MKRIVSFFLLIIMLISCIPMPAGALGDDYFDLGQDFDDSILAGGIYDMYAWVGDNSDDYTFQWQVDLGLGEGNWSDLEDNADPYGYSGTDTYHMQFITPMEGGFTIGTGWENIPFRCVVTNKKTGYTRTTTSIFIKVFSSNDLPEYLKKQGYGLYEPTVTGATKLVTADDINYTASVYAGIRLELIGGCMRPASEHILRRSDVTENVEIWITENGKTIKTGDHTTYTPYTVGNNAVTIQYKLHYTLGIHDMGYYETKTVKLTTKAPNAVARGTANSQISLLRERYNQSEKLVSIPKGTVVDITEKASGWYQVYYNGYVGYVSSSSVTLSNITPLIEHINLTIEEPTADALPATTCKVDSNSCTVTSVEWLDKTADRYMTSGERFQKGHTYQLVVWVTAADGCEFKLDASDKMLATATINGNLPAYTSRAYEQIIGKVMDVRYDFANVKDPPHKCRPTLVPREAPTCTMPGFEAYYYCDCGMCYADAQATKKVDLVTWGKIPATGHTGSGWRTTQTYHYQECISCGETIRQEDHKGGTATCQEKAKCQVCGSIYGNAGTHEWITDSWTYKDENGHAHGCQSPGCNAHGTLQPHVPGPPATVSTPQLCAECGYIMLPAENHTHDLTEVPEVPATCTQPGNTRYYTCSGCSELFSDSAAKNKIPSVEEIIVAPLGHTISEKWEIDGEYHWRICTVCNVVVEETQHNHLDLDGDMLCDTCTFDLVSGKPTEPSETKPDQDPTEPSGTEPVKPDGKDDDAEKETTQKDGQKQENGKGSDNKLFIWILAFLAVFAASVTAGVIIFKQKKENSHEENT